uniref:Uncharacterized protein n=1 Tax=Lepeophtheirus salmonis TaxID=72036 RepID=A0A0K2TAQ3_LEPSM
MYIVRWKIHLKITLRPLRLHYQK